MSTQFLVNHHRPPSRNETAAESRSQITQGILTVSISSIGQHFLDEDIRAELTNVLVLDAGLLLAALPSQLPVRSRR